MIHFGTNFIIQAVGADAAAKIQFRKWAMSEDCNISTVVWSEFLCGPLDEQAEAFARQIFPKPEPLQTADAELAANLFNQTGRRSRSLADCMIAAVAIERAAKLATMNISDFQPFVQHGLALT